MSSMLIASVQFELRPERSVQQHLDHMEDSIRAAAERGAALVMFPELSSTGLLASLDHVSTTVTVSDDYRHGLSALTPDIVSGVAALAAKHGITVLAGSHNRIADDGSLRNTAYLVHPDGRVEAQDKLHLTPQEHAMGARGGDDLLVTRIGDFTVGVLICADIQYPELSRSLLQRGVDLILCPSLTWNRRGVYRVRTGCAARAIENQAYVVMSPLVGSSGLPADAPMHAVGSAIVTTPVDRTIGLNDGVLAITSSKDEELLFAELDRDLLLASRETPEAPGLKLHRPDLYARLAAEDER